MILREMDDGRLIPHTLTFAAPELEAQYWQRQVPKMRGQTMFAVATVLLLYTIFGFLDPLIMPEVVQEVWTIRALVFILAIGLLALTQTPLFTRAHQLIIGTLPALGGLGMLAMMAISGEAGRQMYYVGLILAMIWTLLLADLQLIYALAICLGYFVGYEYIALVLKPLPLPVAVNNTFFLLSGLVMCSFGGYIIRRYNRLSFYQSLLIEYEHERAESLLLNTLPKDIVDTLKQQSGTIAERCDAVSILFADVSGFTSLSAQMTPEEMVELLNAAFSHFDSLVEQHGLEKIRTIGDNYMVASGVPRPRADHAQALARLALEMRDYTTDPAPTDARRLQFRFGMASGAVVAGVIGHKKYQYDLWGTPVNIASRMESHGMAGEIQVTQQTYELLKDEFILEPRGPISIKSVGDVETWLLVGRKPSADDTALLKDVQGDGSPH